MSLASHDKTDRSCVCNLGTNVYVFRTEIKQGFHSGFFLSLSLSLFLSFSFSSYIPPTFQRYLKREAYKV